MADSEDNSSEIRTVFNTYDLDNSGYIGFVEFINLARSLNSRITEEEIRQGFHQIDANGDGRISFEEFQAWWIDR